MHDGQEANNAQNLKFVCLRSFKLLSPLKQLTLMKININNGLGDMSLDLRFIYIH